MWEGSTAGPEYMYSSQGVLGRGSFGIVERGSVEEFRSYAARKSMYLQGPKKRIAKDKERTKSEVKQRARHKHIVEILCCYLERRLGVSTFYLIMSPVGEQDLDKLLHSRP